MEDRVETGVISILSEITKIDPAEIGFENNLEKNIRISNTEFMELVWYLEEEFNIEITDDESDKWETVKDIIDYVKNKDKNEG
jgi:acyl carrier protein